MDRQKDGWTDPILEDPSGRGWESNNLSSASDWWEYTKSCFMENAKIFSKNSTTQENIIISRQNLFFFIKKKQNNNHSSVRLVGKHQM